MYDFLVWLFEKRTEPFEIAFLNLFHILYFAIILGLTFSLAFYLKNHESQKKTALRILAYALVITYIADFFIQPFASSDFTMNNDKLPFHLCTVLCPIVAFTEFNVKFDKFREPVAILAITGSLMYIVYPGNAIGEISPFCYKILQTFIYHGILFAWGVNTLASGRFVPTIKHWYKTLIGLLIIAVWATIGNLAYNQSYLDKIDDAEHHDWLFLTGTSFSFVPPYLMPIAAIAAIFGTAMCVYGMYHLYVHLFCKKDEVEAEAAVEEKTEATV